jgi:hypothetical protein
VVDLEVTAGLGKTEMVLALMGLHKELGAIHLRLR